MSAERIYRWFDKTGCEWMTSDGEAAEKAANSLGANIEVYLPLTDHEAAMKALRDERDRLEQALADVSRQFGDAEAELAKLREAASELIAAEDAWDCEREHDERCRRALNDLRAALRPTTSEKGEA